MNQELLRRLTEGYAEEPEIVTIIKKHLLNDTEKSYLAKQSLDVSDLLNGRYCEDQEQTIIAMFDRWNGICGQPVFGG